MPNLISTAADSFRLVAGSCAGVAGCSLAGNLVDPSLNEKGQSKVRFSVHRTY